MILSPFGEMSTEVMGPSCLASMKKSLKSSGQTLRKLSVLPVTQNPSFISIAEWENGGRVGDCVKMIGMD